MRTFLVKVIAILALTGAFVWAQQGNPPDLGQMAQHHLDHLTKALSLTPAQQQQASTIFSEAAADAKTVHQQMRTAHDSLKTAIQKNDSAGIDQAANTIGNLTTQMIASHAKAQAAFYQTLTPEQQAKMNELESHRGHGMGMRGWRGHGGPGGPPPGESFK